MRRPILLLSGFAFFIVLMQCAPSAKAVVDSEGTVIMPADLFKSDRAVSITGPWRFYWGQLLFPADFATVMRSPTALVPTMRPWTGMTIGDQSLPSSGVATYVAYLRLPTSQSRAGLWFPHQFTAVRVFIDGKQYAEVGTIGANLEDTVAARQDTTIFFQPRDGLTEIIFQIANSESFRGGMRGELVLGSEYAVRRYTSQKLAFELVTMGVVFGAAVYHLGFFVLNRRSAFLYFAILCATFAIRIPFYASKSYLLVFEPISWNAQLRFLYTLNVWSVPLGILYIRSLFPDLVSRRTVAIYGLIAAVAFLLELGNLRLLTLVNSAYLIVMLGVTVLLAIYVLRHAIRARRSASLLAVGLGAMGLFGAVSIVQNSRGHEGGAYALASFFFFVLFQALALSRFFQAAIEAEAGLTESLRESKLALVQQREELQVSLHDSLGGALTDLQVHTERLIQTTDSENPVSAVLSGIHGRIADTVKMFRSQILFMEDLEMTAQNLLPGMQMTLLRRYADAGREIDFEVSDSARKILEDRTGSAPSVARALDLFFLVTELCTNDLKHGQGESFWLISLDGSNLHILQGNGVRVPTTQIKQPHRATVRVRQLSGSIQARSVAGEWTIEARIPLRGVL